MNTASWPASFSNALLYCAFLIVLMHAFMYAYRGRCTFDEKFAIAKSAKAAGVIVINNELSVFAMPSSGLHAARVVAAPDATQGSVYCDFVLFEVVFAFQLPIAA